MWLCTSDYGKCVLRIIVLRRLPAACAEGRKLGRLLMDLFDDGIMETVVWQQEKNRRSHS